METFSSAGGPPKRGLLSNLAHSLLLEVFYLLRRWGL